MIQKDKISIVIVTWNSENDIAECIDSIIDQAFENWNLLIVDNNSSDSTIDLVKENYAKDNRIKFEKLDKNLFLTGGNNYGIRKVIEYDNPEFIMILNPDTKLEKNLLKILLKKINSNHLIGAVGPKVKFYKNENEGKINSTGLIYDGFLQAYDRGFEEIDNRQYDSDEFVFGVTGAGILYRRKMLEEIGLYYENIKLYLDEVELFIRARKNKWKVLYTGSATLYHKYMQSTDKSKIEHIKQMRDWAWVMIAMRHYSLKSKIAVILKYLKGEL